MGEETPSFLGRVVTRNGILQWSLSNMGEETPPR